MDKIAAMLLLLLAAPVGAACPPQGQDIDSLRALKAAKFAVDEPARKQALAIGLLACLGDADPELRDGIAYEALSGWMRAGAFDATFLRGLRDRLYVQLDSPDSNGVQRPFAALVLSELARTDRVAAWMSEQERDTMVAKAAGYVAAVDDYRGFDKVDGWRHGVAHGADWLMQLALNPALEKPQLDEILRGVSAQVVPAGGHAYVFGEPARLARPVLFVAQRGLHSEVDWNQWFAALPARLGDASLAYKDEAWLGRRHDLQAFLLAIIASADGSGQAGIAALEAPARAAYAAMP